MYGGYQKTGKRRGSNRESLPDLLRDLASDSECNSIYKLMPDDQKTIKEEKREYRKMEDLTPWEDNPREISPKDLRRLMNQIKKL